MNKNFVNVILVLFFSGISSLLFFSFAPQMTPLQRGDIIKDIIQSIPTPLEISSLIKETGGDYSSNRSSLNQASNVSRYNTSFKKAINLGIYGTDLGFANLYGRSQDALSYLSSVKKLADGLDIGQFFDYTTLRRLVTSSDNLSELLNMTTSNFEKLNFHLRKQKRDHLSILILTGGWLEALYLTTKVYKKRKNKQLKEKIGEQKIVLDQILLVLDVYKTKQEFPVITRDLVKLQKIFDKIEVETIYGPPVRKVLPGGEVTFIDGSVSNVKISETDINTIYQLVVSTRNNMVR